jgi:hypothetical protein
MPNPNPRIFDPNPRMTRAPISALQQGYYYYYFSFNPESYK